MGYWGENELFEEVYELSCCDICIVIWEVLFGLWELVLESHTHIFAYGDRSQKSFSWYNDTIHSSRILYHQDKWILTLDLRRVKFMSLCRWQILKLSWYYAGSLKMKRLSFGSSDFRRPTTLNFRRLHTTIYYFINHHHHRSSRLAGSYILSALLLPYTHHLCMMRSSDGKRGCRYIQRNQYNFYRQDSWHFFDTDLFILHSRVKRHEILGSLCGRGRLLPRPCSRSQQPAASSQQPAASRQR